MGVVIPSIPYKSQYDLDASDFVNDCGPACLAMLLSAFGVHASINAIYRRSGAAANRYVSIAQLMNAARSYELEFEYFHAWTVPKLIEILREGRGIIALVHYGTWSQLVPSVSTQSSFAGPHFVTVVGADDKHVYVNDPLWKEDRRVQGFRKAWSHAHFQAAWNSCHMDGNRNGSGIITKAALPVAAYGEGAAPPLAVQALDTQTACRIRAWACFNRSPQPVLTNPATTNAYLTVMGGWGTRVARHVMAKDEDLRSLSLRYYRDATKWRTILAFNGLAETDPIRDGDVLSIPQPLENPVLFQPSRTTSFQFQVGKQ